MRIVVWGINYSPEVTGIGPCNVALCEYLAANGHEVEMLTTFAYYPAWRKSPEDQGKLFQTELMNGVCVRRCWHFVPSRVTTLKRILHELSFVLCSSFRFFWMKRPDVFVVVSPPLLLGFAAWIIGRLKGSPFIFHVQDLQPDAAVGLGMLKPGLMTRLLYWLESIAYRKATKVSGISRGMLQAFAEKGVGEQKLVYFPNGVLLNDGDAMPPATIQTFRERNGFAEHDFLAVYSGNIGAKQGLQTLAQAAPLIRNPRVKIIVCGNGAYRDALIAEAKGSQIYFFPLLEEKEYRQMMVEADLCLITQASGTGRVFFPSKLLAALAHSKPISSVADEQSELARAIGEAGCGLNVIPDRPSDLAEKLDVLAAHPEPLSEMGRRGRAYVAQFERSKVLGEFEDVLKAEIGKDES